MFIKTQNETILNMDRVTCCDILKSLDRNYADIRAKADGYEFEIYSGTPDNVEDAFHTIQEGLIKGASFIDFSKEK